MKVIAGIPIGWATLSALMFAALCWRTLRQADAAGLRALAEIDPIEPDPQWVNDLYAHLLASDKDHR